MEAVSLGGIIRRVEYKYNAYPLHLDSKSLSSALPSILDLSRLYNSYQVV